MDSLTLETKRASWQTSFARQAAAGFWNGWSRPDFIRHRHQRATMEHMRERYLTIAFK